MFLTSKKVEATTTKELREKIFSYRTSLSDYLIDFSKRDTENDWPNQISASFNSYPENLIFEIEDNIQDKLKDKEKAIVATAHILLSLLERSISSHNLEMEEVKFLNWGLFDSARILPTTFNVEAKDKLLIDDISIKREVHALAKCYIVDYLLKNFEVIENNIFKSDLSSRGRFQLLEAFSSLSYLNKQVKSIQIISEDPLNYDSEEFSSSIPTIDPLHFWSLGRLKTRFSKDTNKESVQKLNSIYEGRSYISLWHTLFLLQILPQYHALKQSGYKMRGYWRGEAGFLSAFKLSHEILIAVLKLPLLLSGAAIALTALTSYPFYLSHKMLKGRRFKNIRKKLLPVLDIVEGIKDILLLGGLASLTVWGIYSVTPLLASLLTFSSLSVAFVQKLNLLANFQYLFQPAIGVLATVAGAYTVTNAALFIPRIVISVKTGFEKTIAFFKKPKTKVTLLVNEEVTVKTNTAPVKTVTQTITPSEASPSKAALILLDTPLAEGASSLSLIMPPLASPVEAIKGDLEILAQPMVFSAILDRTNASDESFENPLRDVIEENFRQGEVKANLSL